MCFGCDFVFVCCVPCTGGVAVGFMGGWGLWVLPWVLGGARDSGSTRTEERENWVRVLVNQTRGERDFEGRERK